MNIIKYKKKHKKKRIVSVKKKFLGLLQLGNYGIKASTSGILTIKQIL